MKKILLNLVLLLILISVVSSVVYADNYDATADIVYDFDESSNTISVSVSIKDIKDSTGIVLLEYDIIYDGGVLELQSSKVNMPSAWEPFAESGLAEDLSHKRKNENVFRWSIVMAQSGYGVKSDNELNVTLVFKFLKNESTEIGVKCINLGNDNLEEIYGNSAVVDIKMNSSEETPSIDVSDVESIASPTVSNTNSETVTGSYSDVDASNDITKTLSAQENSIGSLNKTDNNTAIYVIIGIIVALAVLVLVVFLLRKRKA